MSYKSEIWKDVAGYKGKYKVSNMGRILSMNYARSGKKGFLKMTKTHYGYSVVSLKRGTKQLVHRVVAEAFIPNEENKKYINHLNSVRTDNRVENLEWCTPYENMRHAWDNGRMKKVGLSKSKVNNNDRIEIYNLYLTGNYTQNQLSQKYGITQSQICRTIKKIKQSVL